ncbi:MAG: O-antigen ligase family protein [Halodesulfovibrio sp.]
MQKLIFAFIFIFIMRVFETYPLLGALRLERVMALALIIGACVTCSKKLGKFPGLSAALPLILVIFFSGITAHNFEDYFITVENYIKIVIFWFIMASCVTKKEDFRNLIFCFIAVVFLYEAKSLYEYAFHGRVQWRMGVSRLMGIGTTYADPNSFAATVLTAMPFSFALYKDKYFSKPLWNKIFFVSFFGLSSTCVVLTSSRAGMVALGVLIAMAWWSFFRNFKSLVIVALIVCVGFTLTPVSQKERLLSLFMDIEVTSISERSQESAEVSAHSRLDGFLDGFRMMLERPVLGFGAGNFASSRYVVDSRFPDMQPHNLPGQIMGELGLCGVLTFVAFVWWMVRSNLRLIRRGAELAAYSSSCLTALALLFLLGFGAHNLYRYTWLWFAAFTSIMLAVNKRDEMLRAMAIKANAAKGPSL